MTSECQSVRGEWGKPCPDCGQVLPVALPWGYGRPCSRTALERGYGWDGRPAPQHTPRVIARWTSAAGTAELPTMSPWMRRVVDAMLEAGGNREVAADALDYQRSSLGAVLSKIRERGDLTAEERAAVAPMKRRTGTRVWGR